MNQSKKFAKKSIAAFAASALVLSGGSTVLAAESGSYKETEKAALENLLPVRLIIWICTRKNMIRQKRAVIPP